MRSPLGQYSEVVAALTAVAIILAAIGSRPFAFQDPFLDTIAGIALGAIFGSTATANGVKAGQARVEAKLDAAAEIAAAKAVEKINGS